MMAQDQYDLGMVAEIIAESDGGAHADAVASAAALGRALHAALEALTTLPIEELLQCRYARYRAIGRFQERQPSADNPLPPLPFKGR